MDDDEPGPANLSGRFLTVAEVAESLRVSRMTVYRLVHSGEVPAVRVGRSFRLPESAVRDYLASSPGARGYPDAPADGAPPARTG